MIRQAQEKGVDLYLVYNEVLNTDGTGKIFVPPLSGDRAVLLKYSYMFNL